MKTYELIEHTADIGIRVKAKDLKGIFRNTAAAMFDIIAVKKKKRKAALKRIVVAQRAANKEELLLAWLNELLSLSAVKGAIFRSFNIKKLDGTTAEALVTGEGVKGYEMKTEIKAATFNRLLLKKTNAGWVAEVVFDV